MGKGFLRLLQLSPTKHHSTNDSYVSNTTSEVGNRSDQPVWYNLDPHASSLSQQFIGLKVKMSILVTYLEQSAL
jgi:hypothetical protein